MKIETRLHGLPELLVAMASVEHFPRTDFQRLLERFGLDIQRRARLKVVANTGHLRRGIRLTYGAAKFSGIGPSQGVVTGVETTAGYGGWVEGGSGPHRTSQGSESFKAAILRWVQLKGLGRGASWSVGTRRRSGSKATQLSQDKAMAFLIMRAIRRRGTRARPFMGPALTEATPGFLESISAWFQSLRPGSGRR